MTLIINYKDHSSKIHTYVDTASYSGRSISHRSLKNITLPFYRDAIKFNDLAINTVKEEFDRDNKENLFELNFTVTGLTCVIDEIEYWHRQNSHLGDYISVVRSIQQLLNELNKKHTDEENDYKDTLVVISNHEILYNVSGRYYNKVNLKEGDYQAQGQYFEAVGLLEWFKHLDELNDNSIKHIFKICSKVNKNISESYEKIC